LTACRSPAEVGVFAIELDCGVEAAGLMQRVTPHREVAAVEDGTNAQQMLDEELRERREREVVRPDEQPADQSQS
jgi:hypothetical protein